jgi:hypothetical protein
MNGLGDNRGCEQLYTLRPGRCVGLLRFNLVKEAEVEPESTLAHAAPSGPGHAPLVTLVLGRPDVLVPLLERPRVPDLGAGMVAPDVPQLGEAVEDEVSDDDADEDAVALVVVWCVACSASAPSVDARQERAHSAGKCCSR